MKLLLVEDRKALSNIIAKGLRKCAYAVDTVYDGEEAIQLFDINEYDLIILDLNLPKIDGLEVLSYIRKNNNTVKIIILSARCEIDDRVKGLDMGANDYLIKPFDFKELEARIRCLLRQQIIQENVIIEHKNIRVDISKKCVYYVDEVLNLTKKEYSILEFLLMNKGKNISSEEIIEHVWESDADLFSNSLKTHIYSLKKKIAYYTDEDIIKNNRKQGYIIE